jgi:hypothetical protein
MPRRCVLATAQARLPPSLDDGLLGAHRRRLLQRAGGRVLDLSLRWTPNLAAYRPGALSSLTVTGPRQPVPAVTGVPSPEVVADRAGTPTGTWDTIVFTFTLCAAERPAARLAAAAERLAPGGQVLVMEHIAGTGLTGVVQHLVNPLEWAAGTGCRFDLDVPAAARDAGLALVACALWVAATVPTPCLAGVLVPDPSTAPTATAPRGAP